MNKTQKKVADSAPRSGDCGAAILRSLPEDKLIDLLDRLRLFAAKRYYGALNCDDLAMQAITEVLVGKRSWNPAFTTFQNLCWIIRSIAANQLEKERRAISIAYDADRIYVNSPHIINPARAEHSPANDYETDETRKKISHLLRKAINKDSLLGRIVDTALNTGRWKPKEIAAKLNISESEVHNARRRIRRRLEGLLRKSKRL
jgi:DNA-directed RNA polymerase specialized sigma24 family protein